MDARTFAKGLLIMSLSTVCVTHHAAAQIKITEEDGIKLFRMENRYYEAVFVPDQAMFPLYYHYKPSGKDILVRKPDLVSSIRSGDGIQFCLPWVGDSLRRVPAKGLLTRAVWRNTITHEDNRAILTSETDIAYDDPVTQLPAKLACRITVTGTDADSRLQTDFLIENTGENPARLMFVAHARLAPDGEYRDGDYLYTPADKCWVSDFNWPALESAGVTPQSWTDWPVPGMDQFTIKPPEEQKREFAYAFIPATWLIAGNSTSKNFVLFKASPVKIGTETQTTPYYCILRRDNDYLVEVGVSRELDAKYWDDPGATVTLAPGEKLAYTLNMAAGQGLTRDSAMRITDVQTDKITFKTADGEVTNLNFGN